MASWGVQLRNFAYLQRACVAPLAACMFLGAALYSSVGHAGASAYIAFMALFSVPPAVMRPTALTLNILVASFASYRYVQAGYFRWRVMWPFMLGALPFAFIGGAIQLPGEYYRPIVGGVLILAGNLSIVRSLPVELPVYIVAVMLGALVGTIFGTKFSVVYIRRALGLVLIIAGLKLIGVY